MRRSERVARELRAGQGLEAAARRLAETLHEPEVLDGGVRISGCPPSAQAAVARELRMTLAAIAASGLREQGDDLDELAAQRKKRRERFG